MELNPRMVRFAVAVAERGSFTAAAADCFVTQPTLSSGIAQLEATLGERLFVRTTRSVALTPFGAHLLPYMVELLRVQATLATQAHAYLEPAHRLLRVGTSPLIRNALLSRMLEPYRASQPGVEIVLREMNMADLRRMLADGLLDVVLGVAGEPKGSVVTVPLYQEPLQFLPRGAARPRGRKRDSVTLAEIADETYVMVPDACGLARTTRALFRRHRRTLLEYSGEALSYQVLAEWATLGIGAAILPRSKVADGHSAFGITDKSGQVVTIAFEAMWLRTGLQAPHLRAFATHLTQVVPRIVAGLKED